jgi:hypothetical protein
VRDGYRKGIRAGEARGQAKSLLALLDSRGIKVSSAVRSRIRTCNNAATLDRWFKNALHASSLAEVIGAQ